MKIGDKVKGKSGAYDKLGTVTIRTMIPHPNVRDSYLITFNEVKTPNGSYYEEYWSGYFDVVSTGPKYKKNLPSWF